MAIAWDAATGSNVTSTSLTFSHTCTGNNRCLIVSILLNDGGVDQVTGVTYGAVSMTRLARISDGGPTLTTYLYGLLGPATGANDVVVSVSPSQTIYSSSSSYTGVKQSGLPDSSNTGAANTTALTVSTTTVADNCWLVGGGTSQQSNIEAGTSTTRRDRQTAAAPQEIICDSNAAKSPAGSYSLQTTSSPANLMSLAVISIAPAPISALNSTLLFMGVG